MNLLLRWLTSPEWTHVVGALLHSLWQGALIAIALAILMRRLTNPVMRYRCALGMLGVLVVASILTWAVLNAPKPVGSSASPIPVSESEFTPTPTSRLTHNSTDKVVVIGKMSSPAAPRNWTAWLALVWMGGTVIMLLRAGIKVAGAENLRRSCKPLDDEHMLALVAEACRAVALARRIRVAVTDKLTSPAVVGVILPTLILPLSLFSALTPEQIRFVLLHELAHIRRGDYLANLFQLFAEALLFFNPAVWWISHQIRREREACCDALAIELSGAPADYARTLVRVAENILQPAPTAALAFGDDGREPSPLADRVQRLLVPGYRPSLRLTWRAILTSLIVGGTLLVLSAIGTRNTVGVILTSSQPTTSPVLLGPGINPDVQPRVSGDDSNIQTTNIPTLTEFVGYDLATAATFVPTPITGTGQSIDSVLPLPIFRVRQITTNNNVGDGQTNVLGGLYSDNVAKFKDKVPFLGDLPFLGKLFTSESSATRQMWFSGDDSFSTSNWTSYASAPMEIIPLGATSGSFTADASGEKIVFSNGAVVRFNNQKLTADFVQIDHKTGELLARGNARLETTNGAYSGEELILNSKSNRVSGKNYKLTLPKHTISSAGQVSAAMPRDIEFKSSPASGLENWMVTEQNTGSSVTTLTNGNSTAQIDPGNAFGMTAWTVSGQNQTNQQWFWYRVGSGFAQTNSARTNAPIAETLYTRTFNLPLKLYYEKTGINPAQTNGTNQIQISDRIIHSWLAGFGIDLDPALGKSVFYSDGKGLLLVRATLSELDAIEAHLQSPTAAKLATRTFQVEPVAIAQAIESLFPQFKPVTATNVTDGVRALLQSSGVNLSPPKSIYYNDRAGGLFVRATKEDLDAIESLLQVLGRQPTQVNLKVRWVEIPQEFASSMLLSSPTNALPLPIFRIQKLCGVLTDKQTTEVLGLMKSRNG
ncbi:MAG: M48 family metalloprotease, partial [Akkermansiaceae bacterium]|nr:M48 family metalloprotease [Verrucomicrobiales bacterium]